MSEQWIAVSGTIDGGEGWYSYGISGAWTYFVIDKVGAFVAVPNKPLPSNVIINNNKEEEKDNKLLNETKKERDELILKLKAKDEELEKLRKKIDEEKKNREEVEKKKKEEDNKKSPLEQMSDIKSEIHQLRAYVNWWKGESKADTVALLTEAIQEYFQFYDFSTTLECFQAELAGKQFNSSSLNDMENNKEIIESIINKIKDSFDKGQSSTLFDYWEKYVPLGVRKTDAQGMKLELLLYVHFAVLPLRKNQNANDDMNKLKEYLENSSLSEDSSVIHYFSLPRIHKPQSHKSFQELFDATWVENLKKELISFLQTQLCNIPSPRLVRMLLSFKSNHTIFKYQMEAADKKNDQLISMLEIFFGGFVGLIDLATKSCAELNEGGVEKKIIKEDINKFKRLLSSNIKQLESLSLPLLSLNTENSESKKENVEFQDDDPVLCQVVAFKALDYNKICEFSLKSHESALNMINSLYARLMYPLSQCISLFHNDPKRSLLLKTYKMIIREFISGDVIGRNTSSKVRKDMLLLFLGLPEAKNSTEILDVERDGRVDTNITKASKELIRLRASTLRLLDAVASSKEGREYLLSSVNLINRIVCAELPTGAPTNSRQYGISFLQKFSLDCPNVLINDEIMIWIIHLFYATCQGNAAIRDKTMVFGSALLFNLLSTKEGLAKFQTICSSGVNTLSGQAVKGDLICQLVEILFSDRFKASTSSRISVSGCIYSILLNKLIFDHTKKYIPDFLTQVAIEIKSKQMVVSEMSYIEILKVIQIKLSSSWIGNEGKDDALIAEDVDMKNDNEEEHIISTGDLDDFNYEMPKQIVENLLFKLKEFEIIKKDEEVDDQESNIVKEKKKERETLIIVSEKNVVEKRKIMRSVLKISNEFNHVEVIEESDTIWVIQISKISGLSKEPMILQITKEDLINKFGNECILIERERETCEKLIKSIDFDRIKARGDSSGGKEIVLFK